MSFVELVCVKERNKLRVRILTSGYYNNANCQFPRDLRVEGRKFRVNTDHVKLITVRGKYFYSVKNKSHIEIVNDISIDLKNFKVFEDNKVEDCAICLCNTKDTVFYPCGHYYCCNECSNKLSNCPICRNTISQKIEKSLIQ